MVRREERKAQTRAAIRTAARERFIRDGYAGTTIRDVAAAAGVSVGTVHAHFDNKQHLLLACFQEQLAGAVALGLADLPEAPVIDQLVHLARVLYLAYGRHPALSREMFAASLWPAAVDAEEHQRDPLMEDFLAEVAGLFGAALERGELQRLPGHGMLAARSYFCTYLGVLIGGLGGAFGRPGSPEALAAQCAALRALLAVQLVGLGAAESMLLPVEEP